MPSGLISKCQTYLGGLMKLIFSFSFIMLLTVASGMQCQAVTPCSNPCFSLTSMLVNNLHLKACNMSTCPLGCNYTPHNSQSTCNQDTRGTCTYKYYYFNFSGSTCNPDPCYSHVRYKIPGGPGEPCSPTAWISCN